MIETHGLKYGYQGGTALAFADVSVVQGGTLLLRGPSGCGKSTWLALAAGLLTPSAGEVRVAGQSMGQGTPAQRDQWRASTVGFLPQKLHLSAALSVEDNLALAHFAGGRSVDRTAIVQVLAALDLSDLARRLPSQLSGGQAQRVALARAVLLKPRVILVDEPTASLDDAGCAAVLALLDRTARSMNATLVIATHDARVWHVLPNAQTLAFASQGQGMLA